MAGDTGTLGGVTGGPAAGSGVSDAGFVGRVGVFPSGPAAGGSPCPEVAVSGCSRCSGGGM